MYFEGGNAAGTNTFKAEFWAGAESFVNFNFLQAVYGACKFDVEISSVTPMGVPNSVSVTEGFTKSLYLGGDPGSNWKSSNTKVAVVDKKGTVKGKKPGKATISCTMDGKTYKCQVTVRKNVYVDKKSYTVNDFSYSDVGIVVKQAYYKGKNIVLKCRLYNNRMFRITKFKHIRFKLYNEKTGARFATKTFRKVKKKISAYGSRAVTFKIPVKKKIDLVEDRLDYGYDYVYIYKS